MRARRPPDADERAPDYSHRFHAGNVGDVWKHCVLVATLRALGGAPRVDYVDSHAGEGGYALGATGEWTEGVGRVAGGAGYGPADAEPAPPLLAAYLEQVQALAPDGGSRLRWYPGSPAFAAALLGPRSTVRCFERDDGAAHRLAAAFRNDNRVQVQHADGLAGLGAAVAACDADEVVVLVDPPYSAKAEWLAVPDALIAAALRTPRARFLLWYPVKSLTRPNALLARLEAGGVRATTVELITTPLELQRNRLNGSGVVLVRPPPGVVSAVTAIAPALGARCATQGHAWSLRARAWGTR